MKTYVVIKQFFEQVEILYNGIDEEKANKKLNGGDRPHDNRMEVWENDRLIRRDVGTYSRDLVN